MSIVVLEMNQKQKKLEPELIRKLGLITLLGRPQGLLRKAQGRTPSR